eukprot:1637242-Amphidinium_carterae.1
MQGSIRSGRMSVVAGDGENTRVWCAGVHQSANLIVDTASSRINDAEGATQSIHLQHCFIWSLSHERGHLVAACQWALAEGALCEVQTPSH